ncbi:MAG: DUF4271 domain-containing protein [Cyclobacteriaceae bacterium]|nr:DUF4271 domain-containing protein [Cyclobacteriaceae bacterium]
MFACSSFLGVAQQANGVIYDLRQNWVQYDEEAESFLPVVAQTSGNSVSFKLEANQFGGYWLFIETTKKAHLFHKNVLLTEIPKGAHYYSLDSLFEQIGNLTPMLSIYGNDIKVGLTTLIVKKNHIPTKADLAEVHIKNKLFTSFFIIVSILLLAGLAIIKIISHDIFSQYTNTLRIFSFTTLDEIIYKGRFFANPNIQLISWMSASAAFILYLLLTKLNIHFIDLGWVNHNSMLFHIIHLFIFAVGFLILFIIRYMLIIGMGSIFDMPSISNIHFASHLRLTFYLLLVLQTISTFDYFSVFHINVDLFLFIVFGGLFTIIVLIGIRLSFIIRHPFVQIFLYLCGTEIFLFVFVYKLVVG